MGSWKKLTLDDDTIYIGTTSVALNRASAALTLAGITLTTPDIGVATATSVNKVTITQPATSSTLTIIDGKTLTVELNSLINQDLTTDASPTFAGLTIGTTLVTGAWTSFTPTITAVTGTFTTVSATGYWIQIGKIVHMSFIITITTNGTAAGGVIMTLPTNSKGYGRGFVIGREDAATGKMFTGVYGGGAGTDVSLYDYANAYPGGTGYVLVGGGTYEGA